MDGNDLKRVREAIRKARSEGWSDDEIVDALAKLPSDALKELERVAKARKARTGDLSDVIESVLDPPAPTQPVKKTSYPDTLEGAIQKSLDNPEVQSNVGNKLMDAVLDAEQPRDRIKKAEKARQLSNTRADMTGQPRKRS